MVQQFFLHLITCDFRKRGLGGIGLQCGKIGGKIHCLSGIPQMPGCTPRRIHMPGLGEYQGIGDSCLFLQEQTQGLQCFRLHG